jgi:hypothetical protein
MLLLDISAQGAAQLGGAMMGTKITLKGIA